MREEDPTAALFREGCEEEKESNQSKESKLRADKDFSCWIFPSADVSQRMPVVVVHRIYSQKDNNVIMYSRCLANLLLLHSTTITGTDGWISSSFLVARPFQLFGFGRNENIKKDHDDDCDIQLCYDMIIIGGGASGMFASGASTMLGSKTLLVDKIMIDYDDTDDDTMTISSSNIGGDCTNSACVPSKAIRSVARIASTGKSNTFLDNNDDDGSWLSLARRHATATVESVRSRESPVAMVERNELLEIALISNGYFINRNEMVLDVDELYSSSKTAIHKDFITKNNNKKKRINVYGKKFLISAGASPIVPEKFEKEAQIANIPYYTYRTLLRPTSTKGTASIWHLLEKDEKDFDTHHRKKIVIVGGGATACELGQSLARLVKGGTGVQDAGIDLCLIAPELLPGEDITLQNAAYRLLSSENIQLFLGHRLESILPDKSAKLSNGSIISNVDGFVFCLGREPDLSSLCLENANVKWNKTHGILVNPRTLQSISVSHIYACGDCASEVACHPTTRTATHAAWTGYHAASNAILPKLLTLGSKNAVHSTVPRVIYTDPELICVGLSLSDCIDQYRFNGFHRLYISEENTDRCDMDILERQNTSSIGFVEIRATKVSGRILGVTACGPTASEIANEMSVVINNRLTVRHVAKSLHSYPSYGYLVHRVALSMALNNIWGLLEACGPIGGLIAHPGRFVSKLVQVTNKYLRPFPGNGKRTTSSTIVRMAILWNEKRFVDIS